MSPVSIAEPLSYFAKKYLEHSQEKGTVREDIGSSSLQFSITFQRW